jgi:hypothetical protein
MNLESGNLNGARAILKNQKLARPIPVISKRDKESRLASMADHLRIIILAFRDRTSARSRKAFHHESTEGIVFADVDA